MLVNREPRGPEPAEGRMTAATACRTCGTEPLENARFCHGCGSPLSEPDTHAEYKQVTVLFAEVVIPIWGTKKSGTGGGDAAQVEGDGRGRRALQGVQVRHHPVHRPRRRVGGEDPRPGRGRGGRGIRQYRGGQEVLRKDGA